MASRSAPNRFRRTELLAIGRNKGKAVARYELHTAGKPAAIVLAADHSKLGPGWDEVCYVNATVVDKHGVTVPDAADLITFKIDGPGVIAAVDSANNASHELFQNNERHAYRGSCFAIVKAGAGTGKIHLTASAPGLEGDSVSLKAVEGSAGK